MNNWGKSLKEMKLTFNVVKMGQYKLLNICANMVLH